MNNATESTRRKKISETMKRLRSTTLPPWNKGRKCPQISGGLKGRIPWNRGTHGLMGLRSKHPSWKGGRRIDKNGYVRVYSPNHPRADKPGYVKEHRIVMEKHLNRYLTREEHIHHINGDKTDNRIDNLQIVSSSEHNKVHFPHGFNPKRRLE